MTAKNLPSSSLSRLARLGIFLGALACIPSASAGAETADEDCGCDAEQPAAGFWGAGLEERLEGQATDSTATRTRLDLFVMSLCPYGMQAQAQILPLARRFGDAVDLRLHFIADERAPDQQEPDIQAPDQQEPDVRNLATKPPADKPNGNPDTPSPDRAGCAAAAVAGDGPFASLHGQPEIDESRRQLVIAETWPHAFTDYVLCRSAQGPRADGDEWRQCAQRLGLDPQAVEREAAGPRGEALFRANIRLANELDIDLSPTLLLNGEEINGPYEYNAVARRLCADGNAEPCAEVPTCGRDLDCERGDGLVALCRDPDGPRAACEYRQATAFSLKVLESDACTDCDAEDFLETTRRLFPGGTVERLNTREPQGMELQTRHDLRTLPAFVFDGAFAAAARFDRVRHLLRPLDDGGFALDPRLNRVSYWPVRPLEEGRLDVFAPQVPELEAHLLALWPQEVPLRLHYLGAPGAGESATDESATDERRRRACLAERFPTAALAYARARQAGSTWEKAAGAAGLEARELQHCAATAGDALRQKAAAAARALGLEADGVAVLRANRQLLRRATPADLQALWTPAPGRFEAAAASQRGGAP